MRQNGTPRQPRAAAPRRQDRIARRSRRSAGARAHARAHGVQRQRALQAGRADLLLRVHRRAARAARERIRPASKKRSTCSTCRPTSRTSSRRGCTALADFAGGLTLDPKEIDKERGVVIEEWRGGLGAGSRIRDKQIPVLFYHSRYAERLPIGKPEILRDVPARAAEGFLRHVLSPRSDGGRRRRRHGSAEARGDRSRPHSAGSSRAAPRRRRAKSRCRCTRRRSSASSPIPKSRSRRWRSSQAAAARRDRSPTTGATSCSGSSSRCSTIASTNLASARREVPRRRHRRRQLSQDVDDGSLGASVADGKIADGLTCRRGRGEARARVRVRRRTSWTAREVDGRVLRARLHRARQDRERLVRAGIPELLPGGRAEPRHRVRVQARAAAAAGDHAPRKCRRWPSPC